MTNLENAMLKPAAYFSKPDQVLTQPWSPEDKFRVLRQWKYDIGQLHVATEENMGPPRPAPEPVSIAEIHAAMEALGYNPEANPAPTKGA